MGADLDTDTRSFIVEQGALERWLPWEQTLILRVTGVTGMVALGLN